MKKQINNQEGYALLMVLVIIVVFTTVFLSFLAQSLSNMKQNQMIEKKEQSTSLAEMGIELYKQAIVSEFDDVQQKAETAYQDCLSSSEDMERAKDCAITEAVDYLVDYLTKLESNESLNSKVINDGSSYSIENTSFQRENALLDISFSSKGISQEKTKEILAKMTIDFSPMFEATITEPNNAQENATLDPDPNDQFDNCDDVVKNYDFSNKTCRFGSKSSKVSKSYHSNQKIHFNNTTLKVNGNLSYKNLNNHDFNHSLLYITGDFDNGNQNKIKNATFYIEGSATFGNLNNAENILVCANILEDVKNIGRNVKIYAQINRSGNRDVIEGEEAFQPGGACSIGKREEIKWGHPVLYEDYDYKY